MLSFFKYFHLINNFPTQIFKQVCQVLKTYYQVNIQKAFSSLTHHRDNSLLHFPGDTESAAGKFGIEFGRQWTLEVPLVYLSACRDGLAAKSTLLEDPSPIPRATMSGSQPAATPVPGHPMLSSSLFWHLYPHAHRNINTQMYTSRKIKEIF